MGTFEPLPVSSASPPDRLKVRRLVLDSALRTHGIGDLAKIPPFLCLGVFRIHPTLDAPTCADGIPAYSSIAGGLPSR